MGVEDKARPSGLGDLFKSLSGDLGHTKRPLIKAERHPVGDMYFSRWAMSVYCGPDSPGMLSRGWLKLV